MVACTARVLGRIWASTTLWEIQGKEALFRFCLEFQVTFQQGTRLSIVGLFVHHTLNGEKVTAASYNERYGCFQVTLYSSAATLTVSPAYDILECGTVAKIVGLRTKPELNGRLLPGIPGVVGVTCSYRTTALSKSRRKVFACSQVRLVGRTLLCPFVSILVQLIRSLCIHLTDNY